MTTDKRFQVFISSTFWDLQDEREAITNAILDMGHIPAGMELFGSDNSNSWKVIERTIGYSDYMVLIIAGRYGTLHKSGKSYTEMEYDFAVSLEIPILAFIVEDATTLPVKATENCKDAQGKLAKFRSKVSEKHQVTLYKRSSDLPAKILASLSKTVVSTPRPGWVRGDVATGPQKSDSQFHPQLVSKIADVENRIVLSPSLSVTDASQVHHRTFSETRAIPVQLAWNGRFLNAEVEMPKLAAVLYSFQLRLYSSYLFAFAVYITAISSDKMLSSEMYPTKGLNRAALTPCAELLFQKEAILSPESLAEISVAAIGSSLITSSNPSVDTFFEYWKQQPTGRANPPMFATISDQCWSNCARHYANLEKHQRPDLNLDFLSKWRRWAFENT